jgi:hypothetical protein
MARCLNAIFENLRAALQNLLVISIHPPPTCPRALVRILVIPLGFTENQRRVTCWISVSHGLCRMEWYISVLRDCKIVGTFRRNYTRHTPLSEMFVKFTWLRSLHIFLLQVVSCHRANKICRPVCCMWATAFGIDIFFFFESQSCIPTTRLPWLVRYRPLTPMSKVK